MCIQGHGKILEARGGIEPPIKVLQTFALPLGDRASGKTILSDSNEAQNFTVKRFAFHELRLQRFALIPWSGGAGLHLRMNSLTFDIDADAASCRLQE